VGVGKVEGEGGKEETRGERGGGERSGEVGVKRGRGAEGRVVEREGRRRKGR
jgi:hypothetical protein